MDRIIIRTKAELRYGTKEEDGWHVDADQLSIADRVALYRWLVEYPNAWCKDTTPVPEPPKAKDTRPDVIERPAPAVKSVDPIEQLRKEDLRQQIEQQYADERLFEYQVVQGLVDDEHNAALLKDWIDYYGQGYRADVNVDRAVKALRPRLHWKPFSAFIKRLAGY